MNISPVTGNIPAAGSRPVAAEAPPANLRQVFSSQASGATQLQSEQSDSEAKNVEANRQVLEDAVKQTNDFLKPINNSIQFSLDDDTGKTIVKVIDLATKDVIRQIPSEEMISIVKAIDKMKGLLIQQKA